MMKKKKKLKKELKKERKNDKRLKKAERGWKKLGAEATKKGQDRKEDEQKLCTPLKTINKEFKNINESEKKAKKCQKQY